jgi:hypothetical protein
VKQQGDETQIHLTTDYYGEDLNGLTWHVEEPEKTTLYINGEKHLNLQLNQADQTKRSSVSIAWLPLNYPDEL